MTRKPLSLTAGQQKPKARRFYIVGVNFVARRANWEVENDDVLRGGAFSLSPPKGRRGFLTYPEKPRLVIGKRRDGHPPRDMEQFYSYWLISDRLKVLFESIDPRAFEFRSCDVTLRDGSTGPVYWLCDVVRVLDAFSESTVEKIRRRWPSASFTSYDTLVFNEDLVGDSHIFRTPYSVGYIFCDQDLKDACKQAGIKGVEFRSMTPRGRGAWQFTSDGENS